MFHLDAGVDFHEVVAVAVNDAFKGRGGVEADRLAEARRFFFHSFEDFQVAFQRFDFGFAPGFLGAFDAGYQHFLRDGYFEQFLLVHLQGAVAAAERDAPVAVAEQLDFIVAGLFDVQFDQDVFVVADAVGFDFVQDFTYQRRCFLGGVGDLFVGRFLKRQQGSAKDTLPFAAAAADRFNAEAALRVLFKESHDL